MNGWMDGTDRRTTTRAFGRRARSVVVVLGGRPVVARDDAHRVDTHRARRRSASIVTGGARHVAVRVVFGE